MAIAPERQHVDRRPISRRRIAALAAALLVNPATLAIEVLVGREIDPAPYLIGGVVIGLLVIARLGDALRSSATACTSGSPLMELLRRQALYDALDLAAQPQPLHRAIGVRLREPIGRPRRWPSC